MKKSGALKRSARVELADNLELAVVVNDQRLCARISPSTARQLAGVLLQLAGAPPRIDTSAPAFARPRAASQS